MKKVFVTGAGGFIGSHLVESLVIAGYSVRAFVRYNSKNSWGWIDFLEKRVHENIEIVSGDITDPFILMETMKGCEIAFNLAALIGIPFSYKAPEMYCNTNIIGTLNFLEAARKNNVSKVIQTSTSEVYGTAQYIPIDEKHPLSGQSPYSASKIASDQLAFSYYTSFGLPVTIIRPFNTYGPRQSLRAVIPTIITQILSGSQNINLGAVNPTRDFNYIKDTVSGFISAINVDNCSGETINLGSNYEISVLETAKMISSIMGKEISIKESKDKLRPKNSEVERLYACNKKAKEVLGWEPKFSGKAGFEKGLIQTIEWFSNSHHLDQYKTGMYNV